MFTAYDSECPVCRGQKKVQVLQVENNSELGKIEHFSNESWGYACSENEKAVEGFCPQCGIKFIYPY